MSLPQDTGISSKAMSIMNSFINDIFEKIGAETAALARCVPRHAHEPTAHALQDVRHGGPIVTRWGTRQQQWSAGAVRACSLGFFTPIQTARAGTTRSRRLRAERSRHLCASFCPASWPSTPCLRCALARLGPLSCLPMARVLGCLLPDDILHHECLSEQLMPALLPSCRARRQ